MPSNDAPAPLADGPELDVPVVDTPAPALAPTAAVARNATRIIMVVLLVIGLLGAGLGLWWWKTGLWNPQWGAAEHATSCPAQLMYPADPANTRVNVYNSTELAGKAARAATELEARGFSVGTVTNAQLDERVSTGAGVILSGPTTLDQALAVQRQVPGARVAIQSDRSDRAVDLVLGSGFTKLVPASRVSDGAGHLSCLRPHGGVAR